MSKTKNAFVIIHFGSNIKYLELELYFCIMLNKFTQQNIIYLYSTTDTPEAFIHQIEPFVYKTMGFDDTGITFNVNFPSKYTSFNTLRTCDFIFAYNLVEYEKICIVESDLVIMGNIDNIFNLNTPSIVCYKCGEYNLNKNMNYSVNPSEVIEHCDESGINGGVILINPNIELFNRYIQSIPIIAERRCKYPNEALFEFINNNFFNLPVKYNLSHYHTLRLKKYGMNPNGSDVLIYHFNETDFKHLDIIKDGWLKDNLNNPEVMNKYRVKKIPILYFENMIYNPYKAQVDTILNEITNPSDWIESFSNKYKTKYWFNRRTGKSVWEKPSELKGGKKKLNKKNIKKTNKKHKNNKKTKSIKR